MIEAPEANFMKLVQGLIEDTDGREHFLKVKFTLSFDGRCDGINNVPFIPFKSVLPNKMFIFDY